MKYIITVILFVTSSASFAEDFPFNSSESEVTGIEKGLSAKEGLNETDQQALNNDKLAIGGSLRTEQTVYQLQGGAANDFVQTPNTLTLYLDSKFANDVRGYFHGKFIYDSTVDPSGTSPALPGQVLRSTISQLDEMKIQFPIEKALFVTLGVQKIKWGSGQFWNPTDFLNRQSRNLFEKEDTRAGLSLLKLHLPVHAMNFYAIGDFEKTSQTRSIGYALRAELPFASSLLNGEASFTQYSKNGIGTLYGVDLSTGIGPFDVIIEAARSKEGLDNSRVIGFSYQWQYSDEDFLSLSLESYHNENGVSSKDDYLPLLTAGTFEFFHAARDYQLVSVYLPKPGQWQNSDVLLTYIINSVDQSSYSRFGYTWTGLRDLSLSFFAGKRNGAPNSEMRLAGLSSDFTARAEVKF